MNVEILPSARNDLFAGYCFYEEQNPGLGVRFYRVAGAAIDSLREFGGIHRKLGRFHRVLIRPFPYAIYYRVAYETCFVDAVVDCRRDPE